MQTARSSVGGARRRRVDPWTIAGRKENRRRGTRLPLRLPVAIRVGTFGPWTQAWTVNISRSGVLLELRGDTPVSPRYLEFVLCLSAGLPSVQDVRCRGRVVRVERARETSRVAVTIDDFQDE